ncbi:MAG: radical SAM protein [Desulfurococcaceae archaeon]
MNEIQVFRPGFKYPSISITGDKCWLQCTYCRGRFLKTMIYVDNPNDLKDFVERMYNNINGFLLSGGFNKDGYLPIEDYLIVLSEIKEKYDLSISIHPGLMNSNLIERLSEIGIDVIDYELITDEYVIRYLKNLVKTPRDFIEIYEKYIESGFKAVVPHIPIGLGKVDWVYDVIDYLTTTKQDNVVFLIAMDSDPTIWRDSLNILRIARNKLNNLISLGCMRPFEYKRRYDKLIINNYLVDRIVNPIREIVSKGNYIVYETCCSLPNSLLNRPGMVSNQLFY